MRVLISVLPGLGHFHPMVPLCRALVDAGHEVVVAVPSRFVPVVERTRLPAQAVGPNWLEEDADALFPGFTAGDGRAQMSAFAELPTLGLVEDLVRLARSFRPDLVLHDHVELSGWLAAELVGIPNVPFAMTARALDPAMLGLIAGDRIAELLAHFGLPPDPDLVRPSRWLYLDSIPPSFASAVFPPGPTVQPLRYSTEDRSGDEQLPAWFAPLGERRLVHVTLGSVFNRTEGLMQTLVAGAAQLDVDVVVTTGRNVDPASLGRLPEHVRAARYIPQSELLPRCDAVVCHGGFNTVFAALSVGVPVVVVPLSADQPLNAYLCASSGLGRSCTTELPEGAFFPVARPQDVTPEQVTDALSSVLLEDSYRQAASRMQREIALQPPVERGVELMEQLVTA